SASASSATRRRDRARDRAATRRPAVEKVSLFLRLPVVGLELLKRLVENPLLDLALDPAELAAVQHACLREASLAYPLPNRWVANADALAHLFPREEPERRRRTRHLDQSAAALRQRDGVARRLRGIRIERRADLRGCARLLRLDGGHKKDLPRSRVGGGERRKK